MPSYRPHGTITRLAEKHGVSRQTIYKIAAAAEGILSRSMEPGPHGPRPQQEKAVWVNRDRLERRDGGSSCKRRWNRKNQPERSLKKVGFIDC
jgi:transposase-like protein